MTRIALVVPVLNEAPNIPRLFEGLGEAARALSGEHAVSVVLVDDGSTDGTAEAARAAAGDLDLTVLTHPRNLGPGQAFGTAFEHLASELEADDLVITLEGDNTSRTELIATMVHRSKEGHDAVFASPYMYGGGVVETGALRVFMSHVANTFVKELLGVRGLLTISSFFRLYRGSTLLRLQRAYGPRVIERSGFESMVEVVMKMMYLRLTISELPMVLDTSRRLGKSKLNVRRTALGYVALMPRRAEWQRKARGADTG